MYRKSAKKLIIATLLFAAFVVTAAEAKRVLYLGDSLSMGAFGKTLDGELRSNRNEVYTYVTGGATPYYWLSVYDPMSCSIGHWEKTPESDVRRNVVKKVPKVEDLIARHQPEVVIVQTGTNLYATLRSKRRSKQENIRELTNLIENMCKTVVNSGAELYWISPPDAHTGRYPRELQEEMLAVTHSVVDRYGVLFESGTVTRYTDPYPKTDGIHYGPTQAKAWGEKVAANFTEWSAGRVPRTLVASAAPAVVPRPEIVRPAAEVAAALAESAPPQTAPAAANPPPALVASAAPVVFAATTMPARADDAPPEAAGPAAAEHLGEAPEAMPPHGGELAALAAGPPAPAPAPSPDTEIFVVRKAQMADGPSDTIDVSLTLRAKSTLPHMSEVTYKSAFAIYEWEVDHLSSGTYPYNVVRIAHPVVWNSRRMGASDYEIGRTTSLKLTVLSAYPSLEQLQTIDDLPLALELPVYTASLD